MRKRIALVVAAGLALLAVPISHAVLFGQPDGNGHPQVGLVVFYNGTGTPTHRCTGTLLSSTVFLTAGHCTDDTASARVYFQSEVTVALGYPLSGGVTGSTFTYPTFGAGFPDTGDVGVVRLNSPVMGVTFATLAPAGYLNSFATKRGQQDTRFKIVGYGLQGVKPDLISQRTRYRGEVSLINLGNSWTDGANIQLSSNPGNGTGPGGLCFGDSGGPVFHDADSLQVVAVNSFVKGSNGKQLDNCRGSGFSYRTDQAAVRNWINSFLS